MEKKLCQSCALPLTQENKGSNEDKSLNEEYCYYCYNNGEYTEPMLTLEIQIKKLTEMAVSKMNLSMDEASDLAKKTLPLLKRWK